MKLLRFFFFSALTALLATLCVAAPSTARPRVIVSTDIGGTDPDDFQSMVHLFIEADRIDLEGLISSPFEAGRMKDILDVIDVYARDYPNLRTYSETYPSPDTLRAITKQGETEVAPYAGFRQPTEGSQWIVQCARKDDPRPLHILIWGGIEDLAQALHDAPDILPKLRVYYIGGPNKKWGPSAYQYIADHHKNLFIIESNSTYRGWFVGSNQSGDLGNQAFVAKHVAGHGALGDFFATKLGGTIKMGDTPSLGWVLQGTPGDPSRPGWGGRFVRAWDRPHVVFHRLTTKADQMEIFGVMELVLPLGANAPARPEVVMKVENQALPGHLDVQGHVRFRFCAKAAQVFRYTIHGNIPALDGKTGEITAFRTPPDAANRPDTSRPNWWTDDPSPEFADGAHDGTKTVNRWREDYLRDFAERMRRCAQPAPSTR
ncbi:MAG: DUF1593 domain-containing protein [Opitutaceae bacterium]|nr:DUF1593 domain-containing protein [Opitutaceae bacterium]